MSRARKLYVSEFLKRNKNTFNEVVIIRNEKCENYKNLNEALNQYYDKEISKWYYSEYYGIVIFIK